MWDNEPGVYLRSRASLDELRRHLRWFTKRRDERGRWFYLRLRDDKLVHFLARDFEKTGWIPDLWNVDGGARILSFVRDRAVMIELPAPQSVARRNTGARLFEVMARYGLWAEAGRIWDAEGRPDDGTARDRIQSRVMEFCMRYGFRITTPVGHVAACLMHADDQDVVSRFSTRMPVRNAAQEKIGALAMSRRFVGARKEPIHG